MSFRARLTAAVAALSALVILTAVGIVFSPDRLRARAAGQPLLAGVSPQTVSGIEISSPGAPTVTLRRSGSGWQIPTATATYPVSAETVTNFLRTVAGLTRTSFVTKDAQHRAELGLSPATAKLLVLNRPGAADIALEVGARGPSGDADYVRVRGEQSVYLARGSLAFYLSQPAASWYELHVLPDDVLGTTISSVVVSGGLGGAGALSADYSLRRPSQDKLDQWVMGNAGAPADRVTAGAMASSLANLEGIDFYSGPRPAAGAGLRVDVTTFAGKQYRLAVLAGPEPGKVLVTADWSPWTYLVNALAFQRAVLPESSLRAR